MNIRSLIISSLLVSGLSLGLTTSAQANGGHYPVAHHSGDHGYSHPQQRRAFQRHFKHHKGRCDHHGYSGHQHYGRLNDDHSDGYRDSHWQDSHPGHGKDRDQHDRHDSRQYRG